MAEQSAEEYLMDKGVPTLIDEAVQAILVDRPEDALGFLAKHFAGRLALPPADPALCKDVRDCGGPCTFYLSRDASLLSPADRKHEVDLLVEAMRDTSPFGAFSNKRVGSGRVFNPAALHRHKMVPHHKRLASCFLSQLGRRTVMSTTRTHRDGVPDTVYHVPELRLPMPLSARADDDTVITISAAEVERVSQAARAAGIRDEVYEDLCGEPCIGPPAAEVYGSGEFQVTVGELKRLEASTRISTGPGLPPRFFAELTKRTTRREHIWFFSLCRALPLLEVGCARRWAHLRQLYTERLAIESHAVEELQRARDDTLARISAGDDLGRAPEDVLGNQDWDRHQRLLWRDNSAAHLEYLDREAEMRSVAQEFTSWLDHVMAVPLDYGFASEAQAAQTLSQSLTELCTSACVSQLGHFFVDGAGGSANQITPKPPQPVTFLSAAGLDFNTPTTTVVEASKYFARSAASADDPLFEGWHGFLPGGEHRLYLRVKELYRVIFASCKHHGVRHPSMLPMGLGVFLKNIHPDDRDAVKSCYFRAQWELLSEFDWGFQCYWLNPAEHGAIGMRTLEEGLQPGGAFNCPQRGRYLRCHVAFHNRDVKFLATELAKRSMSPAVLNPSDCAAVMLGLMGYYWETGRATYYVGEEDFATTGTALLAHLGVSDWLTQEHRVIHCKGPASAT
eukprot:TRINITY_DN2272_c0_g1_i1.p1 TRINITY_DN2272_c0_g1~~TRINITY_DN2272_c0_g1_i1.p1  ORF type:complete len:678 (+),score=259.73 TRINITY_DN2272_c0_g1_i1:167-2200(+)